LRRGAAFVVLRDDGCVLVRTRPANGLLGGMTEVPTTDWTHGVDEQTALDHAPMLASLPREQPSPLPSGERSVREARQVRGNRRCSFPKSAPPHPDPLPAGEREIRWRRVPGVVSHVFTHFPLELSVFIAHVPAGAEATGGMRWVALADLDGEALPNLMRKVIAHAGLVLEGGAAMLGAKRAVLKPAPPAPRRAAHRSR
jgi:A/G-specific adenine glycosylase